MVNIKSVRQPVPAQKVPLGAAALQGFGDYFSMQQAREAQEQSDLMSILPALASIKALQPASEGDEGAFELAGQWLKIGQAPQSAAEELASTRSAEIKYSMSARKQGADAAMEFADTNAFQLDALEKKTPGAKAKAIQSYYLQAVQLYAQQEAGGPAAGDQSQAYVDKDGNTYDLTPEQYETLTPDEKNAIKPAGDSSLAQGGMNPLVSKGLGVGAGILGLKAAQGLGKKFAPATAAKLGGYAAKFSPPLAKAGGMVASPLGAALGIYGAAQAGTAAGSAINKYNVGGLGSGMEGGLGALLGMKGATASQTGKSGWLGDAMAAWGKSMGEAKGRRNEPTGGRQGQVTPQRTFK